MGPNVGDSVAGAFEGDEVTGALEGDGVMGVAVGEDVTGVGGTGPGPGAGSPPMVVGKLVGFFELLFVFVDIGALRRLGPNFC